MKLKLILLLCLLFYLSCSNTTSQNEPNKSPNAFQHYFNTLPKVDLPFSYSSVQLPEAKNIKEGSQYQSYEKFKLTWADRPLGKLGKMDNYYLVLDLVIGDAGYVPYLVVYSKNGIKIDSLSGFDKTGYDMGYQANEYITIFSDYSVEVLDTVITLEIKEDGSDEIPGTEKKSTGKTNYRINSQGKFQKVKSSR